MGQDAGDSPMKWLVLSSTLLDEYDTWATGALYKSPNGSWSIQLFLVGFVDNARNAIIGFGGHHATMADLCLSAQCDCQLWQDLLGVVNQQLELLKCGYHAMAHEFQPTREPTLIISPEAEIVLIHRTGRPLQITQWPNNRETKYLGHQESLSNKKPHLDLIKKGNYHTCWTITLKILSLNTSRDAE